MKFLLFFLLLPPVVLAQPTPATGIVHTHDVDLAYEVYGAPSSSTPAIVINGGPGFLHNYMLLSDVFTGRLAQNRQVIFYDQRGVGKSKLLNPLAPVDMAAQVADLEAIRAKLGFQTFDIIGHSWGGLLAMGYAAAHPDHIHKFVIIDSAAPKLSQTLFMFKQFYPDELAKEKQQDAVKTSADSTIESGQSLRRFLRRDFYSKENFDRYIAPLSDQALADVSNDKMDEAVEKAVTSVDLNPNLHNFHFPALIMSGRYDINVAPLTAWKIYKAIPNSKLSIFEKSGHFPFYEEEDQFLKVLNNFLADN
ncbi:alpha/beta fold hydrolase [Granulicella sp. S190]|uniref:alpha/beta fold hydrolase n=1 Tax=Granulicella sp. S190 TaxID=1747226 RepID=UPI00131C5C84|nr:alpha/beta fold hydrolase [Granulicella sp. S190]